MRHNDIHEVDKHLDQLRDELKSVGAPGWTNPSNIVVMQSANYELRKPITSNRRSWLLAGLAASVMIAIVGSARWLPDTTIQVPVHTQTEAPISGHLVTRMMTPVTVHSVSNGVEVRYLESRIVRDGSGLTRVVYVHLPN